ncbi:hypothetical protein [Indioceanicola profundi]|uniref:hypothetical protein n=1 Tax=Indioceanicola profundi TaxID=2220096 RepID=UPI00385003E2
MLCSKRDAAVRRLFCRASKQQHTNSPRTITIDRIAASPSATRTIKAGELWWFPELRQREYLDTIIGQDHRQPRDHGHDPQRPGSAHGRPVQAASSVALFNGAAWGYRLRAVLQPFPNIATECQIALNHIFHAPRYCWPIPSIDS